MKQLGVGEKARGEADLVRWSVDLGEFWIRFGVRGGGEKRGCRWNREYISKRILGSENTPSSRWVIVSRQGIKGAFSVARNCARDI